MNTRIYILISACALAGCAATGRTYSDHLKSQTSFAPNNSRITVYRTGETMQYSGSDTRISLDNKPIGKVAYKGFATFEAAPGAHFLIADTWGSPGACKLNFEASPNTDYYFEVAPRVEHLTGTLMFGLIGAAIESSGKECGGTFSIVPKTKEVATTALAPLKLTE